MAYDGNGNFVRLFSWVTDKNNGIPITSSRMDGEDNGFAAGLTLAVTRDGQGKMAASFIPSVANSYDIGSVGLPWQNGFFNGNVSVGGNLTVTGRVINAALEAFNAQSNAVTNISASSTGTIVFQNANYNNGGYNATTGIFTALVQGLYQFNAMFAISNAANAGAATIAHTYFSKNNATSGTTGSAFDIALPALNIPATNIAFCSGSMIILMNVNDTLRMKMDVGSISGGNPIGAGGSGTFSGALIMATA